MSAPPVDISVTPFGPLVGLTFLVPDGPDIPHRTLRVRTVRPLQTLRSAFYNMPLTLAWAVYSLRSLFWRLASRFSRLALRRSSWSRSKAALRAEAGGPRVPPAATGCQVRREFAGHLSSAGEAGRSHWLSGGAEAGAAAEWPRWQQS